MPTYIVIMLLTYLAMSLHVKALTFVYLDVEDGGITGEVRNIRKHYLARISDLALGSR